MYRDCQKNHILPLVLYNMSNIVTVWLPQKSQMMNHWLQDVKQWHAITVRLPAKPQTTQTSIFQLFQVLTNRSCSVAVLTLPMFNAFVTCCQRRRDSNSPCLLTGRTRLHHTFSCWVSMTCVLPCKHETTPFTLGQAPLSKTSPRQQG